MASCTIDVEISVIEDTSNSNPWLWRIAIGSALFISVLMAVAVVHCAFIGGKWNAVLAKFSA